MAYFVPVSLIVLAAVFIAAGTVFIVRTVKQQIKLYNSIQLVVLRTARLPFLICSIIIFLTALFIIILTAAGNDALYDSMKNAFGLNNTMTALSMAALSLILLSSGAMLGVMYFARCAIVDRGIQLPLRMVYWHRLYYYLVDEEKHTVTISVNKKGPYTLTGTFGPFKFEKNDIEKLKFILNKNKNKFLTSYDVS